MKPRPDQKISALKIEWLKAQYAGNRDEMNRISRAVQSLVWQAKLDAYDRRR